MNQDYCNRDYCNQDYCNRDYYIVENSLRYIDSHYEEQPDLEQLAQQAGISKYHFQRVFTRWAGISPKRFLQYITLNHAKQLLADSQSVLDTSYQLGLSSGSRLYDLFVQLEAITPGEYKNRGQDLSLEYGLHQSPFGPCLIAATARGICSLSFGQNETDQVAALHRNWPNSQITENTLLTGQFIDHIFYHPSESKQTKPLPLLLKGTPFQIKIWEALLRIPFGTVVSYKKVASFVGHPGSARAVGQAVARNPVAFVIPCHRVIRDMGLVGEYRWGQNRKRIILGWEAARSFA